MVEDDGIEGVEIWFEEKVVREGIRLGKWSEGNVEGRWVVVV